MKFYFINAMQTSNIYFVVCRLLLYQFIYINARILYSILYEFKNNLHFIVLIFNVLTFF